MQTEIKYLECLGFFKDNWNEKILLKIILGEVNWILIHFAMTISLDFG